MLSRIVAGVLVVCLALPFPAQAGMLPTDLGQRDHIYRLLDRADVQSRLEAHGVKAADVKARVAAMTDDEVAQLAGQFDSLPAGGTDVLTFILVVFIVLLITDIMGLTHIFPFTKSAKK
jgi:hypothetical protein